MENLNLDRLVLQYNVAKEKALKELDALNIAESQTQAIEQAQKLTQAVAEQIQILVHRRVASIVTRCLKAVFGQEGPELKIDFERKRGKTEAVLKFVKDGMELDPLDSSGGGVVDVASLGLRIASLVLTKPERRRLLCLDEPLKHLSRSYVPRAKEMLETLTEELGFQLILVTHDSRLRMGKIVKLT
jgi:ABC-type nitrate/sulfonate/bicarbonate transport system ATPase subunit